MTETPARKGVEQIHDELRNYLRPRTRRNQNVPAFRRRLLFLQRAVMVLGVLEAA